jgi:hypothetical protein
LSDIFERCSFRLQLFSANAMNSLRFGIPIGPRCGGPDEMALLLATDESPGDLDGIALFAKGGRLEIQEYGVR